MGTITLRSGKTVGVIIPEHMCLTWLRQLAEGLDPYKINIEDGWHWNRRDKFY